MHTKNKDKTSPELFAKNHRLPKSKIKNNIKYITIKVMLDIIITLVVIAMVAYMAVSEAKYLFGKPTGCIKCGRNGCVNCIKKQTNGTIQAARDGLKQAVERVEKETQEIRNMVQKKAPEPIVAVNQIEYFQTNTDNAVSGDDPAADTIDEVLPFAVYAGPSGTRVTTPASSTARFSDPVMFGAFGVADDVAFSDDISSDASDAALGGFQANGAVLVKDGKIVKSERSLPSYQLKDYKHVTELPLRNLRNPHPVVEDLVEADMFDGLQGVPIDERGVDITPPGTATPSSQFAFMNYGYTNE